MVSLIVILALGMQKHYLEFKATCNCITSSRWPENHSESLSEDHGLGIQRHQSACLLSSRAPPPLTAERERKTAELIFFSAEVEILRLNSSLKLWF